jgi:hypothetical protein
MQQLNLPASPPARPIEAAAPRARAHVAREALLPRAYRGEPVERVPVRFMRQTGRCLPVR